MPALRLLPPGPHGLASARPGPDLGALGWVEEEYVLAGTTHAVGTGEPAAYATRVLVRRPPTQQASGTLMVEWLNVSAGSDTAPDWTYLAPEIVRRGHAWAGVSAQYVGVHGGSGSVGIGSPGLAGQERYADLSHPGDAWCYGIYTDAVRALRAATGARTVIGLGESQSAFALVAYLAHVQPVERALDAALVHSRGGAALPLTCQPGRGFDLAAIAGLPPVLLPDDPGCPVLVLQTETDLYGHLAFLAARQPDHSRLRTWEVAGAAHADAFQVGEFESFLGCAEPVNAGQQAWVLRAGLRHLDRWARDPDSPPPTATPLEAVGGGYALDDLGHARGGVRTPAVEAPTQVLSGLPQPHCSLLCRLFGSTRPIPPAVLAARWGSVAAYEAAYVAAFDAAVTAGFLLEDDRAEVLAQARPDLVAAALAPATPSAVGPAAPVSEG